MKKPFVFLIAAAISLGAYAQDPGMKETQEPVKKSSEEKKVSEQAALPSLDGRSFKISFTDKTGGKKDDKTVMEPGSTASSVPATGNPDFRAGNKVILSFNKSTLYSTVFESSGCPYRVNAASGAMVAFTAVCHLNTGEDKSAASAPVQDTKMEIETYQNQVNKQENRMDNTGRRDELKPDPELQKSDELPVPAQPDKASVAPPPAIPPAAPEGGTQPVVPPTTAPASTSGYMAVVSGTVSGNSIQGTLSWTDASGTALRYSFSGQAVTSKDADENRQMGMK